MSAVLKTMLPSVECGEGLGQIRGRSEERLEKTTKRRGTGLDAKDVAPVARAPPAKAHAYNRLGVAAL